ncbi:MAG: hypothetical protein MUD01_25085 [Chloroflexaceae bacterium]|nr:hypothetical protein [Chloroflexaceae bacterium]
MQNELKAVLQALVAEPASEYPVFSVYLDWTTDSNGKRQSPTILEQELSQIASNWPGSGPIYDSFEADRERILDYVNNEAPKDALSLVIFACSGTEVWAPLPLQVPIETYVAVDRYPHTFPLARVLDDYETFAVVKADGQQAQIMVVSLETADQVAETQARETINRVMVGGWSQQRYQSRTDFLITLHTQELAQRLDEVVKQYNVQHIIISTNDSVKAAVMGGLTAPLQALVRDVSNTDLPDAPRALREALDPVLAEAERQQEADAVAALEEQMATVGGLAAVGSADIAMALSKGQVQTLLVLQGFAGEGRECPTCGSLFVGDERVCPYDGTELQPRPLREAFLARALQQGSEVQIIPQNDYLAQHGGVAALLRYRDDVQAVGE